MKVRCERIEPLMAKAQLTTGELEKKHGIPAATFNKIKSGKRNPRPVTVGRLAVALGCSVEYLCGLEEAPEVNR